MITLTLDDQKVRAALDRLARRVSGLSPVMPDIGQLLVERPKERFQAGRAPDGSPWAPNRPVTHSRYGKKPAARKIAGKKPLIGKSRALSTTIAHRFGRNHAEVGFNMPYAVQQFGAKQGALGLNRRGRSIPRGDIPARPYLGLSERDRDNVLLDLIADALRRAAGGRSDMS